MGVHALVYYAPRGKNAGIIFYSIDNFVAAGVFTLSALYPTPRSKWATSPTIASPHLKRWKFEPLTSLNMQLSCSQIEISIRRRR